MTANADFTLDQLRVLVAIADEGSFKKAAESLGRVQGAVSYNVDALETQLGIALFEKVGRRLVLTDAGRGILREARGVLGQADELAARALEFGGGLEPSLSLSVDVLFPPDLLARAITLFQEEFPTVQLHLGTGILGHVVHQVMTGAADLGVSGTEDVPASLSCTATRSVDLWCVVSPRHPLAQVKGSIRDEELGKHVHLVLSDGSDARSASLGIHAPRRWSVGDLETRLSLLVAGLGWSRMPHERIITPLKKKQLVRIFPARWGKRPSKVQLRVLQRNAEQLGPAGSWLHGHFAEMA